MRESTPHLNVVGQLLASPRRSLSEEPDIYVALLGLSPGPRPPDHYALLGLATYEPDVARIRAAAGRQMGRLAPLLAGPRAAAARRLAGEVADARAILTTPAAKVLYDAELPHRRAQFEAQKPRPTPATSAPAEREPGPIRPPPVVSPAPAPVLPPRAVDPVESAASGVGAAGVGRATDASSIAGAAGTASPVVLLSREAEGASATARAVPVARLVSAPRGVPQAGFAAPPTSGATMPILGDGAPTYAVGKVDDASGGIGAVTVSGLDAAPGMRREPMRRRAADNRGPLAVLIVAMSGLLVALVAAGVWVFARDPSIGQAPQDSATTATAKAAADRRAAPRREDAAPRGEPSSRPRTIAPPKSTEAAGEESKPDATPPPKPTPDVTPPAEKAMPAAVPADKTDADATKVDPKRAEAVRKSIAAARKALADRDLDRAEERLDLALLDASSRDLAAEVNGAKNLSHFVAGFWNAVDESKKTLKSTEELLVDGEPVIVVGVQGAVITVRERGQNHKYKNEDMPAGLAVALADRWLADDDANSQVFMGAFLAIDAQGDAAQGRKILAEAVVAGADAAKSVLEQLDR